MLVNLVVLIACILSLFIGFIFNYPFLEHFFLYIFYFSKALSPSEFNMFGLPLYPACDMFAACLTDSGLYVGNDVLIT